MKKERIICPMINGRASNDDFGLFTFRMRSSKRIDLLNDIRFLIHQTEIISRFKK